MFFDNWYGLLRVVVVGICTYAALVVLLRSTGKRTLAKLNAFDFVVTVALGSTLATVLLTSTVSLTEGVTALALLTGLQYAVAWTSVRWQPVRRAVRSEPTMLVYQGTLLRDAMRRERVTDSEVLQALRMQGASSLAEVQTLILESDGSFASVAADPTLLGETRPPA